MARSSAILVCLLGLAAAAMAVNDDQCTKEMMSVMEKYGSSGPCPKVLNETITATSKENCPNTNQWVDCFALFEDSWTDLLDDCEDLFDDSACLKKYGDDEFERKVKDECAAKRRDILAKYPAGDACIAVLQGAIYATDATQCPVSADLAKCFNEFEDDWTDLVDDCEDLFEYSACTELKNMGDDEFESFVKNGAAASSGMAAAVLAAAGAVMLLAM